MLSEQNVITLIGLLRSRLRADSDAVGSQKGKVCGVVAVESCYRAIIDMFHFNSNT
jgi:hypothetical protein